MLHMSEFKTGLHMLRLLVFIVSCLLFFDKLLKILSNVCHLEHSILLLCMIYVCFQLVVLARFYFVMSCCFHNSVVFRNCSL